MFHPDPSGLRKCTIEDFTKLQGSDMLVANSMFVANFSWINQFEPQSGDMVS
jgi:hypothetical protein